MIRIIFTLTGHTHPPKLPCHTQVFVWYNLRVMNRIMPTGNKLIMVLGLMLAGWLLLVSAYAANERVPEVTTSSATRNVPELQGYVNDYAGMISPDAKAQMEEKLKALEQSDSTQIFVLTVPSLEGEVLEEFAIKVFDKWKAGQKGIDNGVILIVAQKERKVRIEVGRGLEGKLTDLVAGRIIDAIIKPKFKSGDFEGGFVDGVAALVAATKGEYKAARTDRQPTPVYYIRADRLCYFLIGVIVMIAVISKLSRRNRGRNFDRLNQEAQNKILDTELNTGWGMAPGISTIALPVIAYITILSDGADGFPWIGLLICAAVGFIIGMFTKVFSNQGGVKGEGGNGRWSSGGGSSSGGWSGGGDSSSSSGGGGGSSGGGGASGDY